MSDEVVQPFGNDWEAEDEPVRGTLVNPVNQRVSHLLAGPDEVRSGRGDLKRDFT